MTDNTVYHIWLQSKIRAGSNKAPALFAAFGNVRSVYSADEKKLRSCSFLSPSECRTLAQKDLGPAQETMRRCESIGASILTPEDSAYPKRLAALSDLPLALYVLGELPDIDDEICLGVVGTRGATQRGSASIDRFVPGLARCGVIIVSGMAAGIDTLAHVAALKSGGRTIAVLGCAIDRVYPAENAELKRRIAENCAVVSEYPPGAVTDRSSFPARNRIISGLSLGVAVVQAPRKSGALITARHAAEQGRDVFAVPGGIDDVQFEGCNQLLRDGAIALTEPMDVLREYWSAFPHRIRGQKSGAAYTKRDRTQQKVPVAAAPKLVYHDEKPSPTADLELTGEQRAVLAVLTEQPLTIDQIAARSGLPVQRVSVTLLFLNMKGYVRSLPGSRYRLM